MDKLPYQREREFRDRHDLLALLELATQHESDGFGGEKYTFEAPGANVKLELNYGFDVQVFVHIDTQETAVTNAKLEFCEKIEVFSDKRGLSILFTGAISSFNEGRLHTMLHSGFKLQLKPEVGLEMFFESKN
jgi:hypothetical protein